MLLARGRGEFQLLSSKNVSQIQRINQTIINHIYGLIKSLGERRLNMRNRLYSGDFPFLGSTHTLLYYV